MSWKPIMSSERSIAESAWKSINAIAGDVLRQSYPPTSFIPSERHASYEEALLLAYMARCTVDIKWGERCIVRLNDTIAQSHRKVGSFSLFGGYSGLGWTAEHVSRLLNETLGPQGDCNLTSEDGIYDEDPNGEIDSALVQRLHVRVQKGLFDLIHGLVGYGVYFLERWPRGLSAEGLELVISALEKIAEKVEIGTTWYSTPATIPPSEREQYPDGYYNLGVAHGVPGIVQFLYQVSRLGIQTPKVLSLLDGALAWLLAQADSSAKRGLRYSSWVTRDGHTRAARPTWCYGDLGIAAVLFQVGEGTQNPTVKSFALNMFEHCLNLPLEAYNVEDACLCHGATGVAHVYNRMYQLQGDCRFKDAALKWYQRALGMFRPHTGVGGYSKRLTRNGQEAWEPWPGFLDGSIGVALGLMAAVTSVEPEWDRALLLSTRFS